MQAMSLQARLAAVLAVLSLPTSTVAFLGASPCGIGHQAGHALRSSQNMAGGRLCPVGNKYSLRQPSTGLRATFVPSKDDMSSASDPDHLVLKDPVVLTDKTTGEQVGIAQHMPLLHGQKKANIHMQERKNYLLFKLSTALDRMLPPSQKSSKHNK